MPWEDVSAAIAEAAIPVTVLPADAVRAAECLAGLGISDRSWLGAVVANTGGLLLDHGWLRVLGSGSPELPDILADAIPESRFLPIGHDVLGGRFAWLENEAGRPTVHYFGPDTLAWDDLELGYAEWLEAMLTGWPERFYETLRWPGWQDEVAACPSDRGIHTWPPPWTREGKDLGAVSRKAMPIAELISFHADAARQVGASSPVSSEATLRPDTR